MLANKMHAATGLSRRASLASMQSVPIHTSPVVCRAAAEAPTAWDSWTPYMQKKKESVKLANSKEIKYFGEVAQQISKAAVGYKPKFSVPHEVTTGFKLQHATKVVAKDLPKDLHDKLEAIGTATLKGALGLDELDYANVSYTTTDIDGALSVTGTILQKGSDKSAVVVFVATETEREASWSRLEGLILHWACSTGLGAPWTMPPEGWTAVPGKTVNKGGAWECSFEKQKTGNNEQMYVLVMQLPIRGVLKSGGLVFVLKGSESQTDRWLKDACTDKDFFVDLGKFPVTKA